MVEKVSHPIDWKAELIRMGIGQGPAFVVMVAMLWIMTTAIKDFVKVEIPKQIKAINEGYVRINDDNLKAQKEMVEKYSESIKYLSDTFNHNIDRIEKRLAKP